MIWQWKGLLKIASVNTWLIPVGVIYLTMVLCIKGNNIGKIRVNFCTRLVLCSLKDLIFKFPTKQLCCSLSFLNKNIF